MDPLANFLTTLRNANALGRNEVEVVASNFIRDVSEALRRCGIVIGVETVAANRLRLTLSHKKAGTRLLSLKQVSKPGRRIYRKKEKKVGSGLYFFLSTPQGVLSSKEAWQKGQGGEVLFEVEVH